MEPFGGRGRLQNDRRRGRRRARQCIESNYVAYLTGDEERLEFGGVGQEEPAVGERAGRGLAVGGGRWRHRMKRTMSYQLLDVNRREFEGATPLCQNPETWLRLAVIQKAEERPDLTGVAREARHRVGRWWQRRIARAGGLWV